MSLKPEGRYCFYLMTVPHEFVDVYQWLQSDSEKLWKLYEDPSTPYHNLYPIPFRENAFMFKSKDSFIVMGDFVNQMASVQMAKQYLAPTKFKSSLFAFSKGNIKRHKDIQRNSVINIGIKNTDNCHTILWDEEGDILDFVRYRTNEAVFLQTNQFHSVYKDDSNIDFQERIVLSLEIDGILNNAN